MSVPFHVILHARPVCECAGSVCQIHGHSLPSVAFTIEDACRFCCSFEQVVDRMNALPRMFVEPDGSFVWVVEREGERSQLDGSLFDDGQFLLQVELKGRCTKPVVDELLMTLGWPEQKILFQLVELGVFLGEAEFRTAFGLV